MVERRLFEDLIESDTVAHRGKKGYTLPVSVAIHVTLLLALIVVPILTSAELPDTSTALRAFLVEPAPAPPPPPPPPPPAPKAASVQRVAPRPVQAAQTSFTAPVDIPDQIKPEEDLGLGVEGGVAGGVEGGVAGGVVGGVIGGISDAPPPPQAVRVGGNIKEPKKIKYVVPVYPPIAKSARIQGTVTLECTISPQGRVMDIRVIRSLPLLDQAAIDAVRQWVFTPTLLNGVPVPVIMTVNVNFKIS